MPRTWLHSPGTSGALVVAQTVDPGLLKSGMEQRRVRNLRAEGCGCFAGISSVFEIRESPRTGVTGDGSFPMHGSPPPPLRSLCIVVRAVRRGEAAGTGDALPWLCRTQGRESTLCAAGRDRIAGGGVTSRADRWSGGVRRSMGNRMCTQARLRSCVHASTGDRTETGEDPSAHNREVDGIGMRSVMDFESLAGRPPRACSDDPPGGCGIHSGGWTVCGGARCCSPAPPVHPRCGVACQCLGFRRQLVG